MPEQMQIGELAPGVQGCLIPSARFKTTRVSLTFYLPLDAGTVSGYAMLPYLLSRSTAAYPDSRSLNARLDTLYGAAVFADADKLGDLQVLRLGISFIDDRYAPVGEAPADACSALLRDLVFAPAADEGGFLAQNFQKEQRLFLERIDGELNDKRTYAKSRCEAAMCADEPYGVPKYGTRKDAEALTRARVYDLWKELLRTAFVRVQVISSAPAGDIFARFRDAFGALDRAPASLPQAAVTAARQEAQTVTERLSVAQGKLVLGFRTVQAGSDADTIPLMVFSDLFGGGPYSRLFANVREKLSLCYYCAARVNRRKGILLVDSGVEFANMQKAEEEILRQFGIMQRGEFSAEELDASKRSLADSARSVLDAQSATDRWYADRAFEAQPLSPEEFAAHVESVTAAHVTAAAQGFSLDTVYQLKGREDAGNE